MGASVITEHAQEAVGKPIGCAHYERKLKLVTPCCDKIYTCHLCHDEVETHVVNRKEIIEIVCAICKTRQPVWPECQQCTTKFGSFSCLQCRLFDDEDRLYCKKCGFSRDRGEQPYFHCAKCKLFLPPRCQKFHRCVKNVSHDNCPVCFVNIHTSHIPAYMPKCGHLLCDPCYTGLLGNGFCTCLICEVSLLNMTEAWAHIDGEIANTPMPPESLHKMVDILCRDCRQKSSVQFHILAVKCLACGSYNTSCINMAPDDFIPLANNPSKDLVDDNLVFRIEDTDGNTDQNPD